MIQKVTFLISEADLGLIRRITILYRNDVMLNWCLH